MSEIGGMPFGSGGTLNSFIVPKVMNTMAATMRRTLNIRWGQGECAASKIDMSGAPRVLRCGRWRIEKFGDHRQQPIGAGDQRDVRGTRQHSKL